MACAGKSRKILHHRAHLRRGPVRGPPAKQSHHRRRGPGHSRQSGRPQWQPGRRGQGLPAGEVDREIGGRQARELLGAPDRHRQGRPIRHRRRQGRGDRLGRLRTRLPYLACSTGRVAGGDHHCSARTSHAGTAVRHSRRRSQGPNRDPLEVVGHVRLEAGGWRRANSHRPPKRPGGPQGHDAGALRHLAIKGDHHWSQRHGGVLRPRELQPYGRQDHDGRLRPQGRPPSHRADHRYDAGQRPRRGTHGPVACP